MVVLNKVIPIDYNYMKKILINKSNEKLLNILNNIFYNYNEKDKNKYITYILFNMKKELKELLDENHFLDLSMSYNYCNHIYKYGRREGELCGAKIFIKNNNKDQKYLCSRHCRNFEPKHRKYTDKTPRCSYIRNNGKQCKHRCSAYNKKCYIHKESEEYKKHINLKINEINKLNKLKYLRLLYYKNKYKNKHYKLKNSKLNYIFHNKKEITYHIYEKIYKNIIKDKITKNQFHEICYNIL